MKTAQISPTHQNLCPPLKHSILSNCSVNDQQTPWSDCSEVQSDLGLCCPHMLQRHFCMEHFAGTQSQYAEHFGFRCAICMKYDFRWLQSSYTSTLHLNTNISNRYIKIRQFIIMQCYLHISKPLLRREIQNKY